MPLPHLYRPEPSEPDAEGALRGELARELDAQLRANRWRREQAKSRRRGSPPSVGGRLPTGLSPAGRGHISAALMLAELELRRLAVRPPAPRRNGTRQYARSAHANLLDCERGLIAERAQSGRRVAALERELREQRARSARAYQAIAELRQELDALWAFATVPPEEAEAAPGEPSPAANRRPRSSTGGAARPENAGTGPPVRPPTNRWLEQALRRLARRSPTLAGRLLVVLVPGAEMDQEHLVSLLAAGRLHRRIKRVSAEAGSVAALKRVLAKPTSVSQLKLEPGLSFALAAVMIDPHWTIGERFTLAYELPGGGRPGPYLGVHDGLPVTVTAAPEDADVPTTIRCPADAMTTVLGGRLPPGTEIVGQERPLRLIRDWLERAQSG